MKQIIVKTLSNYKPAFFIFLFVVVGMQALGIMAQTAPTRKTEPKTAAETAKLALAGIDSRDLPKIKDDRMRKAIQKSYKALKAIADNGSADREGRLIDNFDRTIKDLKSLPQPGGTDLQQCDSSYELCMEICKEIGSNCKLCGITQNGCYLNKLFAIMTKNPLVP